MFLFSIFKHPPFYGSREKGKIMEKKEKKKKSKIKDQKDTQKKKKKGTG